MKTKTYKKTVWLNVYPKGSPAAHITKTNADSFASDDRVALHKVVIKGTYKVK